MCVLCRLPFDFIDLLLAPANRCVHPVNFNVEYAHNLLQCSIINPGVFNIESTRADYIRSLLAAMPFIILLVPSDICKCED